MRLKIQNQVKFHILATACFGKNDGYYYQDHKRLQGYPVSTEITSTDCKLTDIKSPPEEIPVIATTTIDFTGNLRSSDIAPSATPFDLTNPATYNYKQTVTIFDSLGDYHLLMVHYIKEKANTWAVAVYVDDISVGIGSLTFNSSGAFVSAAGINALSFDPGNGAKSPQKISLQFAGYTQYASPYDIYPAASDGMPAGIYSFYMVDDNGYISFNYSNGKSITFSKVAVFLQ